MHPTSPANIHAIDNVRLQELLRAGIPLVDVRRPEEWRHTGIVPESCLLTFFDARGDSDPGAWLRQLTALLPPGDTLALICRSGYRSGLIAEFLAETGLYRTLYNVREGILGWLEEGLPVAAAESAVLPRSA